MKKLFSHSIFCTISIFFLICFQLLLGPTLGVCDDQASTINFLKKASSSEKFKFWTEVASQLNQNLPMQVDSETMALNVAPLTNGIRWTYEMVNYEYSEQPESYWKGFLDYTEKTSITRFCTTPDSSFFRKANSSVSLYYYDKVGKFIGQVDFNAGERCANFD